MVFNNKEGRWLFAFVFFLYLQISVWKKDEDGLPSLDGGWVSGGYWWRDQFFLVPHFLHFHFWFFVHLYFDFSYFFCIFFKRATSTSTQEAY